MLVHQSMDMRDRRERYPIISHHDISHHDIYNQHGRRSSIVDERYIALLEFSAVPYSNRVAQPILFFRGALTEESDEPKPGLVDPHLDFYP